MSCRCQIGDPQTNLSVPPRSVVNMTSNTDIHKADKESNDVGEIFDDPVGYLASLGVTAVLVSESVLPVAA